MAGVPTGGGKRPYAHAAATSGVDLVGTVGPPEDLTCRGAGAGAAARRTGSAAPPRARDPARGQRMPTHPARRHVGRVCGDVPPDAAGQAFRARVMANDSRAMTAAATAVQPYRSDRGTPWSTSGPTPKAATP